MPVNTRYLELPDEIKEKISEEEFNKFSTKLQWAMAKEFKLDGDYQSYEKLKTEVRRRINEELYVTMPSYIKDRLVSSETLVDAQIIAISRLPWTEWGEKNIEISVPAAKELLDKTHLGLDNIKSRVLRYIACQKRIGSSYGTVLLFAGPPGVGKTSVAKTIAEAMGRPFAKVSLAGVSEAGVIKGTSTIYSNCRHGKIVDALINTRSFCPVILLDEIDKVSRGLNGTGDPQYALLDILDSDRSQYIDECLGIPIDLSNVIFIATANDVQSISPILMDRFDVIELNGYTPEEKFGIAKDYLLRDMYGYYGLSCDDISIEDETIRYIIRRFSTEAGVRNLSKTLRQIFEEVVYCKEMGVEYSHCWKICDVDNFFDLEGLDLDKTWK